MLATMNTTGTNSATKDVTRHMGQAICLDVKPRIKSKATARTLIVHERDECNCPTCGAGWLISDLMACLDYAIQEGSYDEADYLRELIKQARSLWR